MGNVQKNNTVWQTPTEALNRFKPDELAISTESEVPEYSKRYGFKVGSFGFILAEGERAEIIDQNAICPIPNTPIWFNGMINVRGNLVPVFDLKLYLDIEDEQHSERLLIIGQGAKAVSLVIDGLTEVVEVNNLATDLPPLPPILQSHTREAYFYNQVIWLDLDYDEFFTELGARLVV